MSTTVVLLVQSSRDDGLEMYAEFLRHEGLAPIAVSNASDALTAASKAAVIVTGILLPGSSMDGIDLIARLRSDERMKHTPIIVLTACVWKTERERAEHAGCDVFLPKPCLPNDLLREVRRLLAASKLRESRIAPRYLAARFNIGSAPVNYSSSRVARFPNDNAELLESRDAKTKKRKNRKNGDDAERPVEFARRESFYAGGDRERRCLSCLRAIS